MSSKGIFPGNGFGRVVANRTERAVDGEFSDKQHPLYYGVECVNNLDYLAVNAVLSELFNCIKDVEKYDPTKLDNLLRAIIELIKKYGFYPNQTFIPDIKDHDPCNNTAEIVLVEKVQENNKVKNILTKINIQDVIKAASGGFDITNYFTPSLVPHSADSTDLTVVVEAKYIKDGKLVNRLESFNLDKIPFNPSNKFATSLESFDDNDIMEGIVVSTVDKDHKEHELKYSSIDKFGKYLSFFDPSRSFSNEILHSDDYQSIVGIVKPDDENAMYHLVSLDPSKVLDPVLYKSSQNQLLNNKKINAKTLPNMVTMSVDEFNNNFKDDNTAKEYLKSNFDKLKNNNVINIPVKQPSVNSMLELVFKYTSYNFAATASIGSFLNVLYSVETPKEDDKESPKPIDYTKITFDKVIVVPTVEAISAIGIAVQEFSYNLAVPKIDPPVAFVHYLYYIPNVVNEEIGLYAIDDKKDTLHPNTYLKVIERKK